ncbi:MAG: 2-amino-3-ketobutyrate coenzyme A ligase [Haliscomenobacter sp.]|jgi:8-amino-7-oxononanoate synthase|nr:2-amino-3-ketobutyrate coenzyme A ligase [Haliscomenobacter sp.]
MPLPFSGTAYLGIPFLPEFQALIWEGIGLYGGHYGGSRRSSLAPPVYEEAEARLAAFAGSEEAIILSSGTLAGQLLIKVLRQETQLELAPGVHPALWADHGAVSNSWEAWAERVVAMSREPGPPLALLCNSVDPLGVFPYDLSFLAALQPRRRVVLVVDDSHGFLLLGPKGRGAYPLIATLPGIEALVVSSLGKAGGIPAGAVLGPEYWIEQIRKSPFFGGASPAPPAYLHAFLKAGEIYQAQRQQLNANLDFFIQRLPHPGQFRFFPGFPAFRCLDPDLPSRLENRQIRISSLSYPTPSDPLTHRIVITSLHTKEDLEQVLEAV